jgi:hypothetical protein
MPVASEDSAGMSAEDLKARLQDLLKQRGVLDEIKASEKILRETAHSSQRSSD